MSKVTAVSAFLLMCGCQQNVVVPTTQELMNNRQLLAEWQAKCTSGEYSHLPGSRKTSLCSTTQNANISIAEAIAAKDAQGLYEGNTKSQ